MTYGQVARFHWLRIFFGLWLLLTFVSLPATARPTSVSTQPATVAIISIGTHSLQVMDEDGQVETLAIGPASAFLRCGLLVKAQEFLPGETALLRRHAGAGDERQVGLLCDTDSAAVLEKYRGRPLTGTILSVSSEVWVVQPADETDAAPLSLRISARTIFQAGGAAVTASAFAPGATITVTTHGLPSGLLVLASVSDTSQAEAQSSETPRRARFVSGLVADVQSSILLVLDKAGQSHTIGFDEATRVKVRRNPAKMADIAVGMRVSAWLGSREDNSGNPIATTLSAYDAPKTAGKKKR